MPPAVIAGGVAAVGSIGGAIIGSSAQKKASNQAAATQQAATDAQLQLGRESLDLNKQIYNANFGVLSPYASRGNVAGDAINALLGLPNAPAMASPLAAPTTPTSGGAPLPNTQHPPLPGGSTFPFAPGTPGVSPMTATRSLQEFGAPSPETAYTTPNAQTAVPTTQVPPTAPAAAPTRPSMDDLRGLPAADRRAALDDYRGDLRDYRQTHVPGSVGPAAGGGAAASPQQQAMQDFANSAGMQFQLQQGSNAINNLYAGRGALQSGAAMKAIQNYGQQTALNNYFMPYMSLLGGQQAVGAGAASSIAGVGQNFGNTAANINGQMGSAINQGAQNIGNLQLANGQNSANMWGTIGGALGQFGSSFIPQPKY